MPRPFAATLFLALPLAACGSSPSANEQAAAPAPVNNYAEALKTMPAGQRTATLYRAIVDAKQQCQQVKAVQDAPAMNGNPAWAATCDTGETFIVSVGPDGIAKVVGPAALPRAN